LSYQHKNTIEGQFSYRTIEMIESPAFMVLSLSAHRALTRLEIEHAHHGGNDNGRLPVTKEDFIEYGIHDHAIAPALRELEALGFIEVTERGRAGNAEFRRPNIFRLTHRHTGRANPTNEWKRAKTLGEAKDLARAARAQKSKSTGGKRTLSVVQTTTEKQNPRWRKPPLHGKGRKAPLRSIFRVPPPKHMALAGYSASAQPRVHSVSSDCQAPLLRNKPARVSDRDLVALGDGPKTMTEWEIRNQQTVKALERALGER